MGSAQIQGQLWSQAPRDWAYLQEPKHTPLWTAMLDAVQVGEGTRFFDGGCGGGGAAVLAHQRGARVTGLDAAEPLVQIAAERVPSGDFRTGDLEELPFEDNAFDVVFAANSIQFTADRHASLREMRRVCADDGQLVVGSFCTPDKVEFSAVFKAIRDSLPEPPPGDGPFGLSAPGVLENLVEQAGFRVTNREEVDCPFDYPDFEALWKANASAGPIQSALRSVSAETLRANIRQAIQPFQRADGSIHANNILFVLNAKMF